MAKKTSVSRQRIGVGLGLGTDLRFLADDVAEREVEKTR